MESFFTLTRHKWDEQLAALIPEYDIYAPAPFDGHTEYFLLTRPEDVTSIIYNRPKPSTPLKTFFLPIKENLMKLKQSGRHRIVIGAPACDLYALSILDEIYLDEDYPDPNYSAHRNHTILIGYDCHSSLEHCHCTTYDYNPWPEDNADLVLSQQDDTIILEFKSPGGKIFGEKYFDLTEPTTESDIAKLHKLREAVASQIRERNRELPDYEKTGLLVAESEKEIWEKYSDTCVSCGACSAICPTCSCFLFIERPEFEKVRSLDTCQYPGFERVAAGEDPLRPLSKRFRNRYMCKYVWKPEKFHAKACTGCGRCIEACIGEINKNELFMELNQKEHLHNDYGTS